jgi:polyhydroxyalkanoate synthesis regulator phasin
MPRLALPVAVLAFAVPLAAGCGGGGGSTTTTEQATTTEQTTTAEQTASATDWANGFCSAFKDWSSEMTGIGQDLQNEPTKDNLQATGDKIKTANANLADSLKALGRPDIENGGQAKDVVDELADQIKSDSDQISNALKDVSSASEIVTAASTLTATLATLQTQVTNALSELQKIGESQKQALKDALANASACQSS